MTLPPLLMWAWLQTAAPGSVNAVAEPDLVPISGGCIEIGCVGDARCQRSLAAPPRRVCLDPYLIDRTEVTVGAYRRCVQARKCKDVAPAGPDGKPASAGVTTRDRHPVTGVSWQEADAYCRWLGKRLPTEAQWERAAVGPRGDGRAYPWGTEPPSCQHAVLDHLRPAAGCPADQPAERPFTRPVCSRPAGNSPEGLCDLVGNAAEWVSDFFLAAASRRGTTGTNPAGPCAGKGRCAGARGRIIKGGGWSDGELFARIHMRPPVWKAFVVAEAGFRCAATPIPKRPAP